MKSEPRKRNKDKVKQRFPRGWNERRVRKVLNDYENQTDDVAVAEDGAAFKANGQTVPTSLVPEIRRLLAQRRGA
jgi:hypothetical protein